MKQALRLAKKGKGHVSPNPMVGCVIYSEKGDLIGKGYHKKYGGSHAEIYALQQISDPALLKGATVYVTLEPCSHYGKTPPCAKKLTEYPIKRVVAAMLDPNPNVNGKGIACLKESGIKTDVGLLEKEAKELNEGYIHYVQTQRPYVVLKVAQTLDGYIAAPDGDSRWITGHAARKKVHEWRSQYDAVMIGRNTALLDNPRLTVRHVIGRQPKRIVIDGPGSLPPGLHLFSDIHQDKTIRITYNQKLILSDTERALALLQPDFFRGETIQVSEINGHVNLTEALNTIGKLGIQSVFVEAGNALASALVRENLADKLHLFIAPKLLGGGSRSFIGLGMERMSEILEFRKHGRKSVGEDILFTGYF